MGILGTPLGWIMYAIYNFVNNYGLALVLFIILTKVALFPMSIKQQKSSAKMMKMSGKQQELQKKYGKDKTRMNEELMKLYEQEGYNPMSGCLPMIIQMVLLFGIVDVIYKPMHHILRVSKDAITAATTVLNEIVGKPGSTPEIQIISSIQSGNADAFTSVLGADVIAKIQSFDMNFLGIDMGATPTWNSLLVIIPILSGVTALLSTLISMRIQKRNGQSMQGAMKYTMMFMPLMSVWIGFSMPAGAGIYWTLSNILMVGQQLIVEALWPMKKMAEAESKVSEKTKEKMRKKRERMAEYNKMQNERKGIATTLNPTESPDISLSDKKIDREALEAERDATNRRIAEARRRMAEKYGENYNEE